MREKMKNIRNNKGGISIIMAIGIFIAAVVITAYTDILSKTYTLQEIQSIMDISGVSALEKVVQEKELKEEIFAINDENKVDTTTKTAIIRDCKAEVVSAYDQLINAAINTNDNITFFKVNNHNVTFEYSKWGLGKSAKKRPQIILDTIATVKIKSSQYYNMNEDLERTFFNAKTNTTFKVNYNGRTDNGETILMVRSVSRVVYR